jgi:hypothetical protein
MSAGNFLNTEKRAYDQYTKIVAAAYTVKTGRVTDNFVFDRVVDVVDPAANFTITLPDGSYPGQNLIIRLSSNSDSKTVTVAAATGSGGDSTMATAGMYMLLAWIDSTTGWVAVKESVTS